MGEEQITHARQFGGRSVISRKRRELAAAHSPPDRSASDLHAVVENQLAAAVPTDVLAGLRVARDAREHPKARLEGDHVSAQSDTGADP
jgi:hypothetical protein